MDERYARQTVLREIGSEGQRSLGQAIVLIVGTGALGTTQASLLARAGIGRIVLVDRDVVELSNLQRQVLFDEGDIGLPKAIAARDHLKRINSSIEVTAEVTDFNHTNAERLAKQVGVVLDGTDNMETRYLINDVCVHLGIPWIYGGAVGTSGLTFSIVPGGPCLRCIFPQPPEPGELPTCDTYGILNTVPAAIAARQATECIKIIMGQKPSERMTSLDLWNNDVRDIEITKNPKCPACGEHRYEFLNASGLRHYASMCGRNAVQIIPKSERRIQLDGLAERLRQAGKVETKAGVLLFKAFDAELLIFEDGRAIVKGTNNPARARTLFSRYIGD